MSKFKVGDKVLCTESYYQQVTAGREYDVMYVDSVYVTVQRDDCSSVGEYLISQFELVQNTKPKTLTLRFYPCGMGDPGCIEVDKFSSIKDATAFVSEYGVASKYGVYEIVTTTTVAIMRVKETRTREVITQ